jgi:hypothetical protein
MLPHVNCTDEWKADPKCRENWSHTETVSVELIYIVNLHGYID